MGKSTFDARRVNAFAFAPEKLVIVGVDTKDDSEHPLWDERINLPLDESMVLSIMAIGVQEPVIVTKVGQKAFVVDGRRRVLHAREANERLKKLGEPLVEVLTKVEKGSEDHLSHVAIATNEIRHPDDVLVKAKKASRMLSRTQDEKQVAVAFGVTTTTIKNWMRLVELAAPVQKAVSQGVLSANAASKLHGLERAEQLEQLDKLKAEHVKTGKRVSGTKASGKKKGPKKLSRQDADTVLTALAQRSDAWAKGALAGMLFALGEQGAETNKLKELLARENLAGADA